MKRKIICISLMIIFLSFNCTANQPPTNPTSMSCNNDFCEGVFIDNIQLQCNGSTDPEGSEINYFLEASFDSPFITFNKIFGGNSFDQAHSVQQTSDQGYIISGKTNSYGKNNKKGWLVNAWLIKTDSLGNMEWDKTFGGENPDSAESVQQTSDQGYIVTGYTESYEKGDRNIFLIKTNPNGEIQEKTEWQNIGSHSENENFNWDISTLEPQSNIGLRCSAKDQEGNSSGYFNTETDITIRSGCQINSADINHDNAVNIFDYNLLGRNFRNSCEYPSWCECADINQDNTVNALDFLILGQQFNQ
ncbi:dockerin type I domain-containing protein [Nanoarchaeota archaeon]